MFRCSKFCVSRPLPMAHLGRFELVCVCVCMCVCVHVCVMHGDVCCLSTYLALVRVATVVYECTKCALPLVHVCISSVGASQPVSIRSCALTCGAGYKSWSAPTDQPVHHQLRSIRSEHALVHKLRTTRVESSERCRHASIHVTYTRNIT